jgi:hypothetical protein
LNFYPVYLELVGQEEVSYGVVDVRCVDEKVLTEVLRGTELKGY